MAKASIASRRTLSTVSRFINEARKEISVLRVVLFGSYSAGRAGEWSDVDLAVVSDDFEGMDRIQRLTLLGKVAWRAKTTEVEALGFTAKEYSEASPLDFLWEIKRTGRVVFEEGETRVK